MTDADPFRPLSADERAMKGETPPAARADDRTPITPIPDSAPEPDWSRLTANLDGAEGKPDRTWTYRDAGGRIVFLVPRWDPQPSDGEAKPRKIIRPVTWCRTPDGSAEWALKAMPAPRPLYRLPKLLRAPAEALIVVVEGEKCADAVVAAWNLGAVTTWSGGAHAWGETDWGPLAGRKVLLIADADDAGRDVMRALAAHLHGFGCAVGLYLPPEGDADDVADWLTADGPERTRARVVKGRRDYEPAQTGPAVASSDASGGRRRHAIGGSPQATRQGAAIRRTKRPTGRRRL